MARAILAGVVGYLTMAVFVVATFTGAYLVLGADRSYKPGSFDVSTLWLVVSFALAAVGALLGGLACRAIAKSPKPVVILAGFVLLLGAVAAWAATKKADPGPRPAEVSSMEAMQKSVQPKWVTLVNPIIGAIGVMAGGGAFGSAQRRS